MSLFQNHKHTRSSTLIKLFNVNYIFNGKAYTPMMHVFMLQYRFPPYLGLGGCCIERVASCLHGRILISHGGIMCPHLLAIHLILWCIDPAPHKEHITRTSVQHTILCVRKIHHNYPECAVHNGPQTKTKYLHTLHVSVLKCKIRSILPLLVVHIACRPTKTYVGFHLRKHLCSLHVCHT